ncbi:MAG: amidase family protein, partial [Chloroflexota bacterium]|nr:amidase family protein [Chloroflexota bacterium]
MTTRLAEGKITVFQLRFHMISALEPMRGHPMDKAQLPFLSATELAALIKSREVSPVEATEAYLERIPQVDGKLNSYITVTADRAMADARQAEQEIASGKYRGPMHGVPIAVKDQLYTKGISTTGGSTILKDFVPDEDAT